MDMSSVLPPFPPVQARMPERTPFHLPAPAHLPFRSLALFARAILLFMLACAFLVFFAASRLSQMCCAARRRAAGKMWRWMRCRWIPVLPVRNGAAWKRCRRRTHAYTRYEEQASRRVCKRAGRIYVCQHMPPPRTPHPPRRVLGHGLALRCRLACPRH